MEHSPEITILSQPTSTLGLLPQGALSQQMVPSSPHKVAKPGTGKTFLIPLPPPGPTENQFLSPIN